MICMKDLIWYPGLIGQLSGEQPKIICKIGDVKDVKVRNGYFKINKMKLTEAELNEYFKKII